MVYVGVKNHVLPVGAVREPPVRGPPMFSVCGPPVIVGYRFRAVREPALRPFEPIQCKRQGRMFHPEGVEELVGDKAGRGKDQMFLHRAGGGNFLCQG